jgi:hypothetical protein
MKKFLLFILLISAAFTGFAENSKSAKTDLPSFTYYYFNG